MGVGALVRCLRAIVNKDAGKCREQDKQKEPDYSQEIVSIVEKLWVAVKRAGQGPFSNDLF